MRRRTKRKPRKQGTQCANTARRSWPRPPAIPVRTLRFYRERKLLPPPRREGRIAWYDDHHLARLRTIAALLERGHTLGGIAELTVAFENGRDVGQLGELLGIGWSEETPVRLSPETLADYFEGEVTPENLAAALDLGYLAADGEEIVHVGHAAAGRLLGTGPRGRTAGGRPGDGPPGARARGRNGGPVHRAHLHAHLRGGGRAAAPLAKSVVEAELTMAMDRLRPPSPARAQAPGPASGPASGPAQEPSS